MNTLRGCHHWPKYPPDRFFVVRNAPLSGFNTVDSHGRLFITLFIVLEAAGLYEFIHYSGTSLSVPLKIYVASLFASFTQTTVQVSLLTYPEKGRANQG